MELAEHSWDMQIQDVGEGQGPGGQARGGSFPGLLAGEASFLELV